MIHFDEIAVTPLEIEVGIPAGTFRLKASALKLQGVDIGKVRSLKIEGVPGLPLLTADGPLQVIQLSSSSRENTIDVTIQVPKFHQYDPGIKAKRG